MDSKSPVWVGVVLKLKAGNCKVASSNSIQSTLVQGTYPGTPAVVPCMSMLCSTVCNADLFEICPNSGSLVA